MKEFLVVNKENKNIWQKYTALGVWHRDYDDIGKAFVIDLGNGETATFPAAEWDLYEKDLYAEGAQA